jgi:hypothetical protein
MSIEAMRVTSISGLFRHLYLFDDKYFFIGVTHTNGPSEVTAEVENDLETQDLPEEVSVEAIGLVEDVPLVETIGPIEDAQEVEAIGHIDDEVSLENNGVVEEPTTGNTFSRNNPRRYIYQWEDGFELFKCLTAVIFPHFSRLPVVYFLIVHLLAIASIGK